VAVAGKASSHWPITLTNGAAALLNLFLPLALVRILSPDEVGRYKVFFLYVMLGPGLFLVSGLTNGLYHWVGKYPEAKAEVRQSWTLLVGITLTLCAIGLVFSPWFASLLKIPSLDVQLILLSIPLLLISAFLEDLMIARGDIWKGSFYASGFNVLKAASIVAAAWWTHKIVYVYWVFFIGTIIRALVGWLMVCRTGEIKPLFSLEKSTSALRYALPVSIAAAAVLALQYVDQMLLSFRLSPAKFAFYAIGCLSIPPLQILEMSVNRVMIPRLSQAFAEEENVQAAELFSEGVSELFRFLLPATIGLMLFSQPIIRILFTERYMASAHFLRFYALVYLFTALPFDAVARARGDGGWILRTTIFFAALSIGATWLATGRWNAMGALIAVLTSQLLMRLYSLIYQRQYFATAYSNFLPLKEMLFETGLALSLALVCALLRPMFSDMRTWFLVTGPFFTLSYFVVIYAVYLRRHFSAQGPIHVLELAQTLGLGGLERVVYSLSQTLHQQDQFKVLVATYDHPDGQPSLVSRFKEAGIPLIQWQKGKGFSLLNVFRLVRIIFSEKTRILHVHDLGPLIYGSLAKVFSLGRVRLVLTLHTLLDIQTNRRYRFYYKFFLHFPDQIIAVSPGVKSGLIALGVRPERIEVIPNGVSFAISPGRSTEPVEKLALRKQLIMNLVPELYTARWLLCLARLQSGKGQDIVLNVWSALPKETRADLALLFVGQETQPGYLDILRQKISGLPDRDRIVLVGPSERPQEWIQSADIFISGSLHEGMPLAPLEAAGCGLPILLSGIEGHRFLEPWAHTFNPRKPEDGAGKLQDILAALNRDGESKFFEDRWEAASSLRERWGASVMSASYAEIFQTN
jgi:O-antigen/teichoic acid export membrane protein/glycosyltransferase involved in cell wall biosynthesis